MTRLRGAVGVLLVTLLLSSCSDDPPDAADPTSAPPTSSATDPSPPPPPTSTSSPSETATSEPVSLTPEETVRAWVAAFNTTSAAGDPRGLEDLSTSECLQCQQLINGLTDIYAQGGSIVGGTWTVERIRAQADFRASGVLSSLIASSGASITPQADAELVREPAEELLVNWRLERRSGRWFVAELTFLT